ncbi:MAG TPA: aromatic amino acid lyase, partial [Longimicrobiales bacterium]|nr:aromatic amino acid lyase [Longimicrobiales bacterium]
MIALTGRDLTLTDVRRVAEGDDLFVELDPGAAEAVERARSFIQKSVEMGDPIYGVTTGFGRMAEVVISEDERALLQQNLVRSHASGVGRPLDRRAVRAVMLLRANALARGHSGCRRLVVERLLDLLNAGVHPVVPEVGSVGASGDLAPLAHIALVLTGEGEVLVDGVRRPAAGVLAARGVAPLVLEAKEGLALINGTQATTGLGILTLLAAEEALEAA